MSLIFFLIGAIAGVSFCTAYAIVEGRKISSETLEKRASFESAILRETIEANRLRHCKITALRDLASAMRGE